MTPTLPELRFRLTGFAREAGMKLALVGGPVRDLLLGLPLRELDFVVEGDAIDFANALLREWEKKFPDISKPLIGPSFSRFGTAKLRFSPLICASIAEIDFASARTETYPRPGRSPEVRYPCTIEADLARRDYSVNSLALELISPEEDRLVDPFGGRDDLNRKVLRILHAASFRDDPARIIRGLRFKARFGFEFEAETFRLLRAAVAERFLATLTPQRRFDEFRKAMNEDNVFDVMKSFEEMGVLREIHPAMALSDVALTGGLLRKLDGVPPGVDRQAAILGVLLPNVFGEELEKQLKDWGLSRQLAAEFVRKRMYVV